jgi:MFS transporter, DHA1 family, tetracycline resistance protein
MTDAQRKAALYAVVFTAFLDLVGLGLVIPIAAPLLLETDKVLGPEVSQASRSIILGALISSFALAQFFGAPILGALADAQGRRKWLLFSVAGTLVGYVGFAIGVELGSLFILFASRILAGVTGGNIAIVFSAIGDISRPSDRARNFGMVGAAFGMGFIIGPFLGGKLADNTLVSWFGLDTPYLFAAVLALLNLYLIYTRLPETLQMARNSKLSLLTGARNISLAFGRSNLRSVFAVGFLFMMGFSFFTQFYQVYLISRFHFSVAQVGNAFALIGICVALTQGILVRKLSGKVPSKSIIGVSMFTLAGGLLLQLVPSDPVWVMCLLPIVALSQGLTTPNLNSLISAQAGPDEQGEIFGISSSVNSLGMAAPPLIAGVLTSMDVRYPILAAATIIFLAWVVFLLLQKNIREPKETELVDVKEAESSSLSQQKLVQEG